MSPIFLLVIQVPLITTTLPYTQREFCCLPAMSAWFRSESLSRLVSPDLGSSESLLPGKPGLGSQRHLGPAGVSTLVPPRS